MGSRARWQRVMARTARVWVAVSFVALILATGCIAPAVDMPTQNSAAITPSSPVATSTLVPSPTVSPPTKTTETETAESASTPSPTTAVPTVESRTATEQPVTDTPTPEPTLAPPRPTATSVPQVAPKRDLDVITLLPPDAIPAINNPGFYDSAADADQSYDDDDLVLGIEVNGDARAYSVPLLSSHEIVNDVVGGEPVAVTW